MSRKKSLEEEINEFLDHWDSRQNYAFLRDIEPIYQLFDVGEKQEEDWAWQQIGGDEENLRVVRLTRLVYLVSWLAQFHSAKLCSINTRFKGLWKRIEKEGTLDAT